MKSLMQDDISVSFLSGKGGQLEKHHVMNGNPYREYAEIYGLWVMLTPEEHRWVHDTSQGRKYGRLLKAMAQEVFEEEFSHEEWFETFHKNYFERTEQHDTV